MDHIRFSFTFMFLYLSCDRKVTATVKVTYLFFTTDRITGYWFFSCSKYISHE